MHPPLHKPHPECQNVIDALIACHDNNVITKFFGVCNDAKAEMDLCFRHEKETARDLNLKKARAFDVKFKEHLRLKEEEKLKSIDISIK